MVWWLDRGWLLNYSFNKPRKYAVKLNRKHNKNLLVVVLSSLTSKYQQCGKSSMRKMIIIIFLPFWIMISWYEMTSSRLLAKYGVWEFGVIFFFFSIFFVHPIQFHCTFNLQCFTYSLHTKNIIYVAEVLLL